MLRDGVGGGVGLVDLWYGNILVVEGVVGEGGGQRVENCLERGDSTLALLKLELNTAASASLHVGISARVIILIS